MLVVGERMRCILVEPKDVRVELYCQIFIRRRSYGGAVCGGLDGGLSGRVRVFRWPARFI